MNAKDRRLPAAGVQLRQFTPVDDAPARTDKVLMRLRLPGNSEALWSGLKPKVRNQVRKGQKAGVDVVSGGGELLDDFFAVYARNMRDLGSPPQSRRLFAAVLSAFPAEARVWVAHHEGRAVGGGLTLRSGTAVEIPWASSLREANRLCVNHAMYWAILADAADAGFHAFHFGRSTVGSGTYGFKKQWGAEAVPLHWSFLGPSAESDARPPGEGFSAASAVWAKLPMAVSNGLGPHVVRRLA